MDKATESSLGDKLTVLTDLPTDTKPVAGGFLRAFDVFLQRKIPLDEFRGTLAAAVDSESVVATLRLLEFARQKNHLPDPIYEVLVSDVNHALRDDEPTQIVEVPSSSVDEVDHDDEPTRNCFVADETDEEQVADTSHPDGERTADSATVVTMFAQAPEKPGQMSIELSTSIDPGSVLRDRFEILKKIGSGGMGVVYKAVDKRREEAGSDYPWVAIKVIKDCHLHKPAALRALEREASKVQRLSHPNIVNVFDFDRFRERFFITMEWLDGMSLTELLRQNRSQPVLRTLALRIIRNVARGLSHAHKQGVVHADIKPNNIYLTKDQQIKLLDFGIAQAISEPKIATKAGFAAGTVIGFTPGYASCEILEGSAPTSQDDIYALGCIAYRLLKGRHIYGDLNALEAEAEGLSPEPIDDLPPGVWESIAKTLKFRREDRTPNVAGFLEDFSPRPGRRDVQRDQPASTPTLRLIQYGIPALAISISIASAIAWWWARDVAVRPEPPVAEIAASSEIVIDESILLAARQAFEEGRLVEPDSENALHYYTEVLATDPSHAEAVAGVELIFDFYLGRFDAALGNDDIEQAIESLKAAGGVKPEDEQVAAASSRLELHGASLVETARGATREGKFDQAETFLDQASLILGEESNLIATARSAVANQREASRLARLIWLANQRIDEDSLIEPANRSAKRYLAQVRRTNPNHPGLIRSTDRLATAILLKVRLAVSAEDYADAEYWLAEVRGLNAQPAAIEQAEQQLAQALLQSALAQEADAEQSETRVADISGSGAAFGALELDSVYLADELAAGNIAFQAAAFDQDIFGGSVDAFGSLAPNVSGPEESADFDAEPDLSQSALVGGETVDEVAIAASTAADAGGSKAVAESPGLVPISAFEIKKYVNPRLPLRSKSDSIRTGWVDVEFTINADGTTTDIEILESSRPRLERNAIAAVSRWEFIPPGTDGRTQARVPFGLSE